MNRGASQCAPKQNKEETTMERKIGEIFEYNGEWYQCVEQPKKYDKTVCAICAFQGNGNCELDRCSGTYRSDKKFVIFKKLEKVGEPIIYMSGIFQKLKSPDAKPCKYCYFGNKVCNPHLCEDKLFLVEIKQNKENMEENELIELLSEKVHNAWMKEKEMQGFSYGKEYDKEKKKHLDMLPYNELKEEVKEYDRATVKAVIQAQKELSADANKLNLKSFSIEAAKSGKPVCTRDGMTDGRRCRACPTRASLAYCTKNTITNRIMKKQALSIEQMNHLRKLGLDTSDASLCWTQDPNGEIYSLGIHDEFCYESSYMNPVPAYTLQDILNKLPEEINVERRRYWLCIDMADERMFYFTDDFQMPGASLWNTYFRDGKTLLDAAYEMLVLLNGKEDGE